MCGEHWSETVMPPTVDRLVQSYCKHEIRFVHTHLLAFVMGTVTPIPDLDCGRGGHYQLCGLALNVPAPDFPSTGRAINLLAFPKKNTINKKKTQPNKTKTRTNGEGLKIVSTSESSAVPRTPNLQQPSSRPASDGALSQSGGFSNFRSQGSATTYCPTPPTSPAVCRAPWRPFQLQSSAGGGCSSSILHGSAWSHCVTKTMKDGQLKMLCEVQLQSHDLKMNSRWSLDTRRLERGGGSRGRFTSKRIKPNVFIARVDNR